jgi:hypothetical protein
MELLNSQKQEIFRKILSANLEPAKFEWSIDKRNYAGIAHVLTYKGTGFYFAFHYFESAWSGFYSPGDAVFRTSIRRVQWTVVMLEFSCWLEYLIREVQAGDPWKRIEQYLPSDEILTINEIESKFTYEEFQSIETSMFRLKQAIINEFDLKDEQAALVHRKLDALIEKAKKHDRLDWRGIFISGLAGLAMELAFKSDQAQKLWVLAKECFQGTLLSLT